MSWINLTKHWFSFVLMGDDGLHLRQMLCYMYIVTAGNQYDQNGWTDAIKSHSTMFAPIDFIFHHKTKQSTLLNMLAPYIKIMWPKQRNHLNYKCRQKSKPSKLFSKRMFSGVKFMMLVFSNSSIGFHTRLISWMLPKNTYFSIFT